MKNPKFVFWIMQLKNRMTALHSESGRSVQNAHGLSDRNIKESAGESTPKKPGKHKNVPPECGQMSLGI